MGNAAKQGNLILKINKLQKDSALSQVGCRVYLPFLPQKVGRNVFIQFSSYFHYNDPNVGAATEIILELSYYSTRRNMPKCDQASQVLSYCETTTAPTAVSGFLVTALPEKLLPHCTPARHPTSGSQRCAAGQVVQAHLAQLYAHESKMTLGAPPESRL